MSQRHNAVPNTHWTNPADKNLLTKTCFSGDKKKCTLSQPKERPYRAKASTPLPWKGTIPFPRLRPFGESARKLCAGYSTGKTAC